MTSPEPAPPVTGWLGPRGKRVLGAGAWSLIAKISAAANLFVAVPFVLEALGPAQFGAWATLVSLVVFAGFLDFGFSNGTMNLVASAHGRGDPGEVGSILREGWRILLWIAICLAGAALVALPLVPWHRLLGMPVTLAESTRDAVACVLLTIALAVPLNLGYRVQLGIGRGDRAFRWQAAGQLLTLAMVVGLAKAKAPLQVLTAAAVATPLLAALANTTLLLRDRAVAIAPTSRRTDIAVRIRSEGMLFFVLQLAGSLAFAADLPLIAAVRGPAEAGTYAIVQRLFSVIPLALSLVWVPLWPIYRHALAVHDHAWVLRTLYRSLIMAIVAAALGGAALMFGFDYIIGIWVHHPLAVSATLLAGFALWSVFDAGGTAMATFLNAAGILRFQVIVAILLAIATVSAKAFALRGHGIAVLPWITMSVYILISVIPTLLLSRTLISRALHQEPATPEIR